MRFSRKKLLRHPAPNRKYPLTGGAEAHNGTPDGRDGNGPKRGGTRKSEVLQAGRAKEVRAHPVGFVSTLFEIASN